MQPEVVDLLTISVMLNHSTTPTLFTTFQHNAKMQYLTYHLTQQDQAIETLKVQVQEKQEGQIQQLNAAVEQEHDLTLGALAGTFTLLTCLISLFHMSSHLRNFIQPNIQRKIVAILWMSPIYSVTAWVSLVWPPTRGYLAIIKDFYEAYVIYTFLSFLISVLGRGDRELAVETLAKHASHLQRPTRMFRHWYHPPPETSDRAMASAVITECQILAMQFVFIRPFTSVAYFVLARLPEAQSQHQSADAAAMHHDALNYSSNATAYSTYAPVYVPAFNNTGTTQPPTGSYANHSTFTAQSAQKHMFGEETKTYFTSPEFVIDMIVNISIFFAFAGLLKFYHAVRDDLAWCQPWPKFITIKGVVFVTFWQGLVIDILVNLKHEEQNTDYDPNFRASQLQNVLICLEMLFFSITHWCVFPAEEWEKDFQPKVIAKPGIGIQDFVSDVSHIVKSSRRRNRLGGRETFRGVYQPASGSSAVLAEQVETLSDTEDDELEQSETGSYVMPPPLAPSHDVSSSLKPSLDAKVVESKEDDNDDDLL